MTDDEIYDAAFYARQVEGAERSARAIVPLLVELVGPRSVLDVGCGLGAWLSVWREQEGVDVLGVDGGHVPDTERRIPPICFRAHDLARPLELERRFDLALCLEVAEHLEAEAGDRLVESLTTASDVVYFSAAIPFQGGAGHRNERWPSYWAERFVARGFTPVDAIRPRVWDDPDVVWWYAQNGLVFVRDSALESNAVLRGEAEATPRRPLDVVHPRAYEALVDPDRVSLRRALRYARRALRRTLRRTPRRTPRRRVGTKQNTAQRP
ncbi:MAG: class I SAM-dependent methyltransferase [bacterium]|nr:class I SAM-dependent methyltransferase [bacterium]